MIALVSSSMNSGTPSARVDNPLLQFRRQCAVHHDLRCEQCRIPSVEPTQGHQADAGTTEPGCREVGPEGNDQKHRELRHPFNQSVEQLERSRVGPMSVLKQGQHWPRTCETRQATSQRSKYPLLPPLRGQCPGPGGVRPAVSTSTVRRVRRPPARPRTLPGRPPASPGAPRRYRPGRSRSLVPSAQRSDKAELSW